MVRWGHICYTGETRVFAERVWGGDNMKEAIDPLDMTSRTSTQQSLFVTISVALIVLAGIGTGYVLAKQSGPAGKAASIGSTQGVSQEVDNATVAGIADVADKDDAQGKLVKGGMDGEGSHHLERDGGPSQYVYLVSSVIDLDNYVDQEVHVWGDTFAAQKAGWFMDVVRLEVVK